MITKILTKKRGAQLAILFTIALAASNAEFASAQIAGFASSRSEKAATAESGPRRALAALNPFHQPERAAEEQVAPLIAQPISQPVVATSRSVPPAAAPNRTSAPSALPPREPREPRAATEVKPRETSPKASTRRASVRPSVAPQANSSAAMTKKSSTGGVASLLLDELEEELGDAKTFEVAPELRVGAATRATAPSEPKVVRKSLRGGPFPSSLELLSDDEEADESEDDLGPASVFTANENGLIEDDSESEYDDEALDDDEDELIDADAVEEDDADDLSVAAIPAENVVSEPKLEQTQNKSADSPKASAAKQNQAPQRAIVEPKVEETAQSTDEAAISAPVAESAENVSSLDSRLDAALAPRVAPIESVARDEASPLRRAPIVEVETTGAKKLVVGQESTYRVTARNVGLEPARNLVVTTDLPSTASKIKTRASSGAASLTSDAERGGAKRCVWKVEELAAGEELCLDISLTPTKRAAFGLESKFEYDRAASCAEVEVEEPILELFIEGRDAIEWGVEDKFRLRLRNIGNGDAEDVSLRVATGENEASQKIGLLRAGEERAIDMSVKTASEDFFVIDAEAVGAYGLSARATKKVTTLRGKLDVQLEIPDLQFVDGEFEATVRVRNLGEATLQNVDVVAQIPEGIEVARLTNRARRNPEKRRVYWVAPFIRPNEETTFEFTCRATERGTAKFEAVGVDQTGAVAQDGATLLVESIASLSMRVIAPKDPIAVGKTCEFELVVENQGTRTAREINTGLYFGSNLKPLSVADGRGKAYPADSKALFKRIERLDAGETATFRVTAEALSPGVNKVQGMLSCAPEEVTLITEETSYCYSKRGVDARFDAETMTADKELGGTVRK